MRDRSGSIHSQIFNSIQLITKFQTNENKLTETMHRYMSACSNFIWI
jgi:hypothetical protein